LVGASGGRKERKESGWGHARSPNVALAAATLRVAVGVVIEEKDPELVAQHLELSRAKLG
jgi:hypothetical protein